MAKARKNVVNLNDFKKKKTDEGAIVVATDEGEFRIPPPELWPDEVIEFSNDGDHVGAARALLGDEYDAFKAAGGSAAVLMAIVAEEHGLTAGE